MSTTRKSRIPAILDKHESELLAEWLVEQQSNLRPSLCARQA